MTELREASCDVRKKIGQYKNFNPVVYRKILAAFGKIRGIPVIHINATAQGGGVAEMLQGQIALERDIGLKSRWLVIDGAPKEFFEATKKIHNLLQGKSGELTEMEKEAYLETNHELRASLQKIIGKYKRGVVMIHDPQPLPLVHCIPDNFAKILRVHIDLSTPNAATLDFLRPHIEKYDKVVLSSKTYKSSFLWLPKSKKEIIMPAIDPLSLKNQPMDLRVAQDILEKFEINCTQPLISQVSRFDPWKDPMGVIKAYYLAKNEIPELQLILAGFAFAKDDPESAEIFKTVQKHAKGDPDIFLFSDPRLLRDFSNDTFISAVFTASDVVVQKSIREGFGLTMTEAMWKGKPLVAGKTAGALLQIKHGKNGLLVSSPEEAARAIVRLFKDKKLAARLGKSARESVKKNFLFPRYLLEHLELYRSFIIP